MRPVFLSYAYPPYEAPRAVQVERLVRHLPGPVDVLCGEVERISGPPGAVARAPNVTRVPWGARARALRHLHARVLRGRLDVPDRYRPWAADAVRELRRRTWSAGDVLVSFGQPWSDHIAALRFVRRADVPWVAHFSDPWTQNPLRSLPRALRPADRRLERAVLERADHVVFTNEETLELGLAACPPAWRGKATCADARVRARRAPRLRAGTRLAGRGALPRRALRSALVGGAHRRPLAPRPRAGRRAGGRVCRASGPDGDRARPGPASARSRRAASRRRLPDLARPDGDPPTCC